MTGGFQRVILGLKRIYIVAHLHTWAKRVGISSWIKDSYGRAMLLISNDVETLRVGNYETRLNCRTDLEARHLSREVEDPIITGVLEALEEEDVFYDIGAHIGIYSSFVATQSPDTEIIAFEPIPDNRESLRANLDINEGDARIFSTALSDSAGEGEFKITDDRAGADGRLATAGEDVESIPVEFDTLDRLREREDVPALDVVKIDVEGAELAVLRGMELTIDEDPPQTIYVEVHPSGMDRFDTNPEELEAWLIEHGFETIELETAYGDRYFLKAFRSQE